MSTAGDDMNCIDLSGQSTPHDLGGTGTFTATSRQPLVGSAFDEATIEQHPSLHSQTAIPRSPSSPPPQGHQDLEPGASSDPFSSNQFFERSTTTERHTAGHDPAASEGSDDEAAGDEAQHDDELADGSPVEVPPPIDLTTREESLVLRTMSQVQLPSRTVLGLPRQREEASSAFTPLDVAADAMAQLSQFATVRAKRALSFLSIDLNDNQDEYAAINQRLSYNNGIFKKFQQLMFQNAKSAFALWLFFAVTECFVLAVYIAGTTATTTDGPTWREHDAEANSMYFKARVALSFVSLLQFGFTFALDMGSSAALILTTLYQLGLFFASLRYPEVSRYYVPLFVRTWTLRQYAVYLFDSAKLLIGRYPALDAMRVVGETLFSFVALLLNFTGIFRINESFQGYPTTFVEALYCMVVTCTTVGYGDISPQTASGKALIVLFVFAFVAELPVVLSLLTSMAAYLERVRGFSGHSRHVVVVGSPTFKEVLTLLNEIITFSQRRSVVFVMLNEVTHRMQQLEKNPLYRNRITFIHVDYLRDPLLFSRSRAAEADAVIILSDKNTMCAHGDYGAMMASRLFDRYAGHVPQLLGLRYGTHTSLLEARHIVMVNDVMKKAILSTALLMPGVIPLLVNLVRIGGAKSVAPPTLWTKEGTDDWRSLYRYSRQNTLHCVATPRACVGLPFRDVVMAFAQHHVLVVGITDEHRVQVRLELQLEVRAGSGLILIAETGGVSSAVAHAIERLEEVYRANHFDAELQRQQEADYSARYATSPPTETPSSPTWVGGSPSSPAQGMGSAEGNLQNSFYPFERSGGNWSVTMAGGGFVELLPTMLERYPFIDRTPRGVELVRLSLDVSDCNALMGMFSQYDVAATEAATLCAAAAKAGGTVECAPSEAMQKLQRDINQVLLDAADHQLSKALDDDRKQKMLSKESFERFVLIDQATSVSSVMLSEYDSDFSNLIAEQSLLMMMQCIRSIYSRSSMTLLSLNTLSASFQQRWAHLFSTPLRLVMGQGTLLAHVEHALRVNSNNNSVHRTSVRGILIYCSQQGHREYEDIPILTVERNVNAIMRDAMSKNILDPVQERHVVVELRTFTSCCYFHPHHTDAAWQRLGEDAFQASLPFMMGKCFSCDMMQTLLVHAFYHASLLKWYELILNVSVKDAQVDLALEGGRGASRTRFKFYGNVGMKLNTFGHAFRLLIKERSSICLGVFRRFPASEGLEGTPRYFITNPHQNMPLREDDVMYALYAGRVAAAPMEPSPSRADHVSEESSVHLTAGELVETAGM